jgi:hypothetical protein
MGYPGMVIDYEAGPMRHVVLMDAGGVVSCGDSLIEPTAIPSCPPQFKVGDLVQFHAVYKYSGFSNWVGRVKSVAAPDYYILEKFIQDFPKGWGLDSVSTAGRVLQLYGEPQATVPQKSILPVCTCPLHGPNGLLAVGCNCGALK